MTNNKETGNRTRAKKAIRCRIIDSYRNVMMQLPACTGTEVSINGKELYDRFLLDKSVSQRKKINPTNLAAVFRRLNEEMLDFLEIEWTWRGSGYDRTIVEISTNRYAGAMPSVLPDGSQGGDIFVYPRHMLTDDTTPEACMEQLMRVMQLFDQQIKPEFGASMPLKNFMDLQPPMYHEAIKYITLFEAAVHEQWRKFMVEHRVYDYPKGSTNWGKYAQRYADPNNWTKFSTRDNVLSTNHPEWRELKYVFELAVEELNNYTTPISLKQDYEGKIRELERKTWNIPSRKTGRIVEHASDPIAIKNLKEQAKLILDRKTTQCTAWRIDIAKVWEMFVQLVMERALGKAGISGFRANAKFAGQGQIPTWGLKYLEPDILVATDTRLLIADAKYKTNMYNLSNPSERIKEEFRHDLHQVLAYCAFAPQADKLALLCYPAKQVTVRTVSYQNPIHSVSNTILMVGIPFNAEQVNKTTNEVYEQVIKPHIESWIRK